MNILILGSEGFIGKHCVAYYLKKQYTVFGVDLFEIPSQIYEYRKVTRLSTVVVELFQQNQFSIIINAAGSANVNYSMTHPVIDFDANSSDTIQVLDAIKTHQPKCKYLHISSAAVYGNPKKLPIAEEDTLHPISPYGWHKLIAENLCTEFAQIFNLQIAIVRPFSVFGPGLKKQMFWDLYQKIKSNTTGVIEIYGTGNESRDYIFIDDLIDAIDCILCKGDMQGEAYNLASGNETTICQVVDAYFKALNYSCLYQFNGKIREGDPLNWKADVSKIQQLNFKPKISLQQGIEKLANWIKAFHE